MLMLYNDRKMSILAERDRRAFCRNKFYKPSSSQKIDDKMGNKGSQEETLSISEQSASDVHESELSNNVISDDSNNKELVELELGKLTELDLNTNSQREEKSDVIVIDLDEDSDNNVRNALDEAKMLLRAANSHFYTGFFDNALADYKKAINVLMKPQNTAEQLSIRKIINFTKETIARVLNMLRHISAEELQDIHSLRHALELSSRGSDTLTSDKHGETEDLELDIDKFHTLSDCVNNIGGCVFVHGNIHTAIDLYHCALNLRTVLDGPTSLAIAESLQNIASCFEALNDFAAAEKTLLSATEIFSKLDMSRSTENTSALNNLGVLYSHMAKHEAAEALLTKALDYRTTALGAEHQLTVNAKKNLLAVKTRRCAAEALASSTRPSNPQKGNPLQNAAA